LNREVEYRREEVLQHGIVFNFFFWPDHGAIVTHKRKVRLKKIPKRVDIGIKLWYSKSKVQWKVLRKKEAV